MASLDKQGEVDDEERARREEVAEKSRRLDPEFPYDVIPVPWVWLME